MKRTCFLLFVILLAYGSLRSQTPAFRVASYAFDADSLNGFDENAARASALAEHFTGTEFKIRLYQLKRRYINDRYSLWPSAANARVIGDNTTYAVAACTNEDFEASATGTITSATAVSGWVLSGGSNDPSVTPNAHSCNLLGCCTSPPSQSAILSTPFVDQLIGAQYPVYSVFGTSTVNTIAAAASNTQLTQPLLGNKVIRINNDVNDYSIEKLTKTFSVTAANSLFRFAFLSVFATSHPCCDAGGMQVNMYNASAGNSLIPCYTYSYAATDVNTASYCNHSPLNPPYYLNQSYTPFNGTVSGPAVVIYNPWQINAIDLSPYINQLITIEVVLTDCVAGGHFGYAYFDAECGPSQFQSTGINVPVANNTTVNINSCAATATLVAPLGFSSYNWSGPAGFTATTAAVQTTVAGAYVLSVGQANWCSSFTQTVNLGITPATVNISSSAPVVCPGNTATLTAAGQGISSYSWNNGITTNTLAVAPLTNTTYTVTGTNAAGCSYTKTITQQVSTGTAGISSAVPYVCTGNSTTLTATGFTNYVWNTGATTSTLFISPTGTSTYSVSGTNADGCTRVASFTQNFIATSLSISSTGVFICAGQTVTLTALNTGYTHYAWSTSETTPAIAVSPTFATVYTVQASNTQGCSAVEAFTLDVDLCMGIDASGIAEYGISLYPNPNSGEFTLAIKNQVKKAELIIESALGQLLYTQAVQAGENKIRLTGFGTGIYYYRIIADKRSIAHGKFKID